jgi:hypothetical protein
LPADVLKKRDVECIDIIQPLEEKDYKEDEDPTKYHSEKTNRGPLAEGANAPPSCLAAERPPD